MSKDVIKNDEKFKTKDQKFAYNLELAKQGNANTVRKIIRIVKENK